MAIKAQFGNGPWTSWPQALRLRKPEALARARASLAEEQNFHRFLQYEFYRQWDALRAYAREKGVKMIGDIPIYVPLDSADLWCSPELFQLDHDRQPLCVAGCPPDSFSQEGQYWGNPLYDWSRMERDGFAWWLRRIAAAGRLFDVIRIDHFRGFESYWSIPAEADSARAGAWVKGPGMKLIRRIKERFPHLDFIAEDLGFLTDAVREMVAQSGFPGMKVLEFAFDYRYPRQRHPIPVVPREPAGNPGLRPRIPPSLPIGGSGGGPPAQRPGFQSQPVCGPDAGLSGPGRRRSDERTRHPEAGKLALVLYKRPTHRYAGPSAPSRGGDQLPDSPSN